LNLLTQSETQIVTKTAAGYLTSVVQSRMKISIAVLVSVQYSVHLSNFNNLAHEFVQTEAVNDKPDEQQRQLDNIWQQI